LADREPTRETPDIHDASLKGTTYKVYRYVYKAGKAVRVNDVQRDLKLSSPSVAQYHIKKLLALGLIREEQEGYVIERVVFENVVRFRRISIPFQAAYTAFFAISLVVLLTALRPPVVTSTYFFALAVIAVALLISVYEAFKTMKRL
jgi:DNA-binding transcriptional ArsR family regulator